MLFSEECVLETFLYVSYISAIDSIEIRMIFQKILMILLYIEWVID